jgi:DNA-binding response OmpR family regulator
MRDTVALLGAGQTIRNVLEAACHPYKRYDAVAALIRGLQRDDHQVIVVDSDGDADWRAAVERRGSWLHPDVPVILVGSGLRIGAADALAAGADDFVSTATVAVELLARIQAAARRRDRYPLARQIELAGCVLDSASSSIVSAHARVELTALQVALAQMFFGRVGQVVSRSQLACTLWGGDEEIAARAIEQQVYQLRRKLARCAGDLLALRSVYGRGYRLDALAAAPASPTVARWPSKLALPGLAGNAAFGPVPSY